MKISSSLILAITSCLAAPLVHGQVYKQVDANGRGHYSDTEPSQAKGRVEVVSTSPASGSGRGTPDWSEKEQAFRRRQVARNEAERAQDEVRRKDCLEARQRAVRMQGLEGKRVFRTDKNGERIYLSDEEREALKAESSKAGGDC